MLRSRAPTCRASARPTPSVRAPLQRYCSSNIHRSHLILHRCSSRSLPPRAGTKISAAPIMRVARGYSTKGPIPKEKKEWAPASHSGFLHPRLNNVFDLEQAQHLPWKVRSVLDLACPSYSPMGSHSQCPASSSCRSTRSTTVRRQLS